MVKRQPTYELITDQDLSKFLLGAIRDVRKSELEIEKAEVISKLADKYTKNQMMILVKEKMANRLDQLDVQKEMNKQLMNKS